MKLSEHGKDMLAAFSFLFDYEFSPEYFKDCVVLTRKEARELIYLLSHAKDLRYIPYGYETCDELALLLTKRIEQAEGKHGT